MHSREPSSHRPKKYWGQHFLSDPVLIRKLVDGMELIPEDRVVEIGPGRGAMTPLLCDRAARVIAVEIDPELYAELAERLGGLSNLSLIHGDFLEVNLQDLTAEGQRITVVGNIPYNLSGPILFKLLESASLLDKAVLMLQKEVADRILAPPGNKQYGALTVLAAYYAHATRLAVIPPGAFFPRPKVSSATIKLDFRKPHPRKAADENLFKRVVKSAFSSRRKMIKNAMLSSPFLDLSADQLTEVFRQAIVDPSLRAEVLKLDAFLDLTEVIVGL